jgi:hypothetical protein
MHPICVPQAHGTIVAFCMLAYLSIGQIGYVIIESFRVLQGLISNPKEQEEISAILYY